MKTAQKLLAAMLAVTLALSVLTVANPQYFTGGLAAYADKGSDDNDEEYDDSDDNNDNGSNSGRSSDDDEDDDEDRDDEDNDDLDDDNEDNGSGSSGKDEDDDERTRIMQQLGENSKVKIQQNGEVELEVEIEDGDLPNGVHDVAFTCDSPRVNQQFSDALNVTGGYGEFEAKLNLVNGTYTGCEVDAGSLSATFPTFNILPGSSDDDDEDEDDEDNGNRGRGSDDDDDEDNGSNSGRGSSGRDDEDEDDEDNGNRGRGSDDDDEDDDVKEKRRHERKERIVNGTSATEIRQRHINAEPASPGDYPSSLSYELSTVGTAEGDDDGASSAAEEDAAIEMEIAVWKSNRAIILLDVLGGTVEVGNKTYTVAVGYALYGINSDTIRIGALVLDDDTGDVMRLKLRGVAVDENATFPRQVGDSIDLTFEGNSGPSKNALEGWELSLEGTVTATKA